VVLKGTGGEDKRNGVAYALESKTGSIYIDVIQNEGRSWEHVYQRVFSITIIGLK
jgi:hypothetical protein